MMMMMLRGMTGDLSVHLSRCQARGAAWRAERVKHE